LSGREGLDAAAAVAGSAACGFFLFVPSAYGFNHFDFIATGGWLGVCTILIPIGMWYALGARAVVVTPPSMETAAPVILGRILCVVAIWLAAEGGTSYWNLVDQGRALPLLMLVLLIGGG